MLFRQHSQKRFTAKQDSRVITLAYGGFPAFEYGMQLVRDAVVERNSFDL